MITSKILTPQIQALPSELQSTVKSRLENWLTHIDAANLNPETSANFVDSIAKVWCCSEFVAESCSRKPDLLMELVNSGDLSSSYAPTAYKTKLAELTITDEADLSTQLRQFRCREMVRIAWRDLAGWADLAETLMELSQLADACIQYALAFLYQQACELRGTPLLPMVAHSKWLSWAWVS